MLTVRVDNDDRARTEDSPFAIRPKRGRPLVEAKEGGTEAVTTGWIADTHCGLMLAKCGTTTAATSPSAGRAWRGTLPGSARRVSVHAPKASAPAEVPARSVPFRHAATIAFHAGVSTRISTTSPGSPPVKQTKRPSRARSTIARSWGLASGSEGQLLHVEARTGEPGASRGHGLVGVLPCGRRRIKA